MNWSWLAFVVGILVGWLIEWLIDYLFWRRKRAAQEAEIARLQQQLEDAQSRQRDLETQAAQCARDLDACRSELEAVQAELDTCHADLEAAEASALELGTRATAAAAAAAVAPEPEPQDLSKIEGIGPQTQALLNQAGIVNFEQLADTPVERLQEILEAAGPRYRIINPNLWPRQARLAAEGKWDELELLQACIVNGEIVQHDLTVIEGIGPKIQGLLYDQAMVNYHQVAAAPVSRLQEVLDAAGPNYRMADPSTWPQQARLAADGEWDALEKFKEDLIGGRVTKEDLTVIEGIGPKIEGLLNEAGIINHWQLADTPVSRLNEILDAAGPSYQMADPSTWPEQSRLADEKKWDELQALQDRIVGGRDVQEDLTVIEGIGPRTAEVLQEAGILNYTMLADAPVERLRELLEMAKLGGDPTTWPQQARLADEEQWDELRALQDRGPHGTWGGGREADESGSG